MVTSLTTDCFRVLLGWPKPTFATACFPPGSTPVRCAPRVLDQGGVHVAVPHNDEHVVTNESSMKWDPTVSVSSRCVMSITPVMRVCCVIVLSWNVPSVLQSYDDSGSAQCTGTSAAVAAARGSFPNRESSSKDCLVVPCFASCQGYFCTIGETWKLCIQLVSRPSSPVLRDVHIVNHAYDIHCGLFKAAERWLIGCALRSTLCRKPKMLS